ncbi:SDR family NAD(P)-dependent oxidoreductase [Rhizobium leguminosarum]|uniref:SDR family NAD(P)-dependent oxidoreductase n=2 Tax=Pseudomonadota TaxID=1224 RepID=A0A444IN27_RHILE|nr:SDR family NAD(P)-dependent oxidoreductase [Rhizobium leguminosarum]MDH6659748.1 NAD(P)-dependent dehydrogenase (short-subunit alcohol dehydrogenase family) [Rhizobium sophorae]ASS54136.1 short-chain dehydrogenase/reductase [Rhizobium leguminosarum bv. viciae]MBB4329024.1 NAD(P)-dependent dehydrogenase (short-subunit alcohol dehydrogenase family) [Rhizobium leguminosarum]MBB4344371.1 NAD(P)-dependent dehydrogenase (short-subunit alcohol dehydrogenase family) [Rhizobium leguminosarum]MBB4354
MSKVWFITGVSSGIGAGVARAALKAGDKVVATSRNLDKARDALRDVAGDDLAFIKLDVTSEVQVNAAAEDAAARFGRIDVAVNNAGYCLLGNFEEQSLPQIEAQFATNFYGVVHVVRAVLPVMRKQRSGHIINIGAAAGVIGLKHCGAYSATKFAIEGLAFSVGIEVEPFGVKFTTVEPGAFRTDLLDSQNVRYVPRSGIEDYAGDATSEVTWSSFHGVQPGDPDKLGTAVVTVAAMENPPKIFVAGTDAIAMIAPGIESRLSDMRTHDELSRSTDGSL